MKDFVLHLDIGGEDAADGEVGERLPEGGVGHGVAVLPALIVHGGAVGFCLGTAAEDASQHFATDPALVSGGLYVVWLTCGLYAAWVEVVIRPGGHVDDDERAGALVDEQRFFGARLKVRTVHRLLGDGIGQADINLCPWGERLWQGCDKQRREAAASHGR